MNTPDCQRCYGEGVIERTATPAEVDAGCELGVAFDPCPACQRTVERTDTCSICWGDGIVEGWVDDLTEEQWTCPDCGGTGEKSPM